MITSQLVEATPVAATEKKCAGCAEIEALNDGQAVAAPGKIFYHDASCRRLFVAAVIAPPLFDPTTAEILRQVVQGGQDRQIAKHAQLSLRDTRQRLAALYRRFDCRNRTQLAVLCVREGWF